MPKDVAVCGIERYEMLRAVAGEEEFPRSGQNAYGAAAEGIVVIPSDFAGLDVVGSSRVDLQACKLEYSIVSPK